MLRVVLKARNDFLSKLDLKPIKPNVISGHEFATHLPFQLTAHLGFSLKRRLMLHTCDDPDGLWCALGIPRETFPRGTGEEKMHTKTVYASYMIF